MGNPNNFSAFSKFIKHLNGHFNSTSEGDDNFTSAVSATKYSVVVPVNMNLFDESEHLFIFVIFTLHEI